MNSMLMKESSFQNLSLPEKESFVKEKGQLLEAQDFYSFFMVSYLVDQDPVRLYYDYSGKLVDVETGEPTATSRYAHEQIDLSLSSRD